LNKRDEKLIWVFLGQKAKKISEECSIKSNYTLVTTHPSPYSAESKEGSKKNNVVYFIGSQIFVKINKLLIDL
jgi:uracil DNA glycosylase